MNPAKAAAQPRIMTAADAIRDATAEALERDPNVVVMGEGVNDPKRIFGTTQGLVERFGPKRVMEMPISENGWTGMAIGAALLGQRPILIHQRLEFALLAVEQLVNNAAKLHYVSAGKHRVPLVVRLVVGRGWGQGPSHSQALVSMFAGVPGLKVVLPATTADAKMLLLAAVADDNPVIMIEHRWVHYALGEVHDEVPDLDAVGPRLLRSGDRATVVASSYMTLETLQAVDALAEAGVAVDLFDLRVAAPLRVAEIAASVRRTGRLIVVEIGHRTLGLGAEIAAQVCEVAFDAMRQPPRRIALPDHPTPSSRSLAAHYYPRSPQIAQIVGETIGVEPTTLANVCETLAIARDNMPSDVPHPSFRGPF